MQPRLSMLSLLLFLAGLSALPAYADDAPRTLRQRYGLGPPRSLTRARTALVLVDFQREFFPGGKLALPGAEAAARRAAALLAWARAQGITCVHVRNVAPRADAPWFAPDQPGSELVPALVPQPSERLVTKSMAGAFSRTDLGAWLEARGIDTLVIAGLMTHLAVDTSARDATVLGFRVLIAADATATRALPDPLGGPAIAPARLQRSALAALADRFADVLPTRAIVSLQVE